MNYIKKSLKINVLNKFIVSYQNYSSSKYYSSLSPFFFFFPSLTSIDLEIIKKLKYFFNKIIIQFQLVNFVLRNH